MYNVDFANKGFIKSFAWLASDLLYDPEDIPTEERVDNWRMAVMNICHEHKSAHKEIKSLQAEIDRLKLSIKGWQQENTELENKIDELKMFIAKYIHWDILSEAGTERARQIHIEMFPENY